MPDRSVTPQSRAATAFRRRSAGRPGQVGAGIGRAALLLVRIAIPLEPLDHRQLQGAFTVQIQRAHVQR